MIRPAFLLPIALGAACARHPGDPPADKAMGADSGADTGAMDSGDADSGVGDTADSGDSDSGDTADSGGVEGYDPADHVTGGVPSAWFVEGPLREETAQAPEGSSNLGAAIDADGDGSLDLDLRAPIYGNSAHLHAARFLFRGPFSGETSLDAPDATLAPTGSDAARSLADQVADPGDLDGDGYADLMVADTSLSLSADASGPGGALFFLGPHMADRDYGDAAHVIWGDANYFASSFAVGDLTGDGIVDLVADRDAREGVVNLFPGPLLEAEVDDGMAFTPIEDCTEARSLPYCSDLSGPYATADLDGDGQSDLLLEQEGFSRVPEGLGAVFGVLGPITAETAMDDADFAWFGCTGGCSAFFSEFAVEDFDADGYDDVAMGTIHDDSAGQPCALVGYGAATGGPASDWQTRVHCQPDSEASLAYSSGDIDGDGVADLLVAHRSAGHGHVYLHSGPLSGTLGPSDATLDLQGQGDARWFGVGVVAADFDSDGQGDFVVSTYFRTEGEPDRAYLFLGAELFP